MKVVLSLLIAHTFALISPGPDLALIIKNSLTKDKYLAYFTALGFAAGVAIHLIYCFAGLGILLETSPQILNYITYLGCAYLVYLAINCFRFKEQEISIDKSKNHGRLAAFKEGFITNIFNGKAALFFVGLISSSFTSLNTMWQKVVIFAGMTFVTFLWFALVANFLTIAPIKEKFLQFQRPFHWLLGLIFLCLSLTLLIK